MTTIEGATGFAGAFETPTADQWHDAVLKVLNRGRPEGKQLDWEAGHGRLVTHTIDGLRIEPLFTRGDHDPDLGFPGAAPFTRGTTVRSGAMDAWDIRALHDDPDPVVTRRAIVDDLEHGVTSIWLRVDPDAVAADDVKSVLADVLLDLAKLDVSSTTDQYAAADALLAVFEGSDHDHSELSLNLGLDPLGHTALTGEPADLSRLADYVRRLDGYAKSRAIIVDANLFSNLGAGDVHEVAWAVASAVEYVRALLAAGLTADQAFDAITFRVTAGTDQFATIARLRALRTVWNRVGEVFGVSEEHRGARQHAVTSRRQLTRDDPYVNMLRGTIQCFGAAVGGAEAITVLPFDSVLGLPTAFSRRVARNTQVVLAEESNIGRVNDPAGGSWYVESLTAQLAEAAWAEFQRVEAAGGMAAALGDDVHTGLVATTLAELNEKRAKALATRAQPITGVSMFPQAVEPVVERQPRPDAPPSGGLGLVRDSEVFEQLRDRAAVSKPTVFLACLGSRRDFGAREGFTQPLLHVAGIATPTGEGTTDDVVAAFSDSGATTAVVCSSAKVYAEHAVEAATKLKQAGAQRVFLAGNLKEIGDGDASVFDGTVAMGMDVVAFLTSVLDPTDPATPDQTGAEQ
ncbi:methylmalonyl-CoA mutase small subunit [Aestuariimicrobium soli]|uniref:methylmalonyl-CoA mutase small subunit n=1 Tax=Aestuariimicrobium soli TaxID=2035834 RepID=UPI003EBAD946